jgi:hypothetical protein
MVCGFAMVFIMLLQDNMQRTDFRKSYYAKKRVFFPLPATDVLCCFTSHLYKLTNDN